jgi:hypothetical protein
MVLQFLLPILGNNNLISKGIQGLAQGGGFGLGYGFMVRAGYDLYGAVKDKLMGMLGMARYTPDPFTSMAGTGGIMGMQRNTSDTDEYRHTINRLQQNGMTQQQIDSLARKKGGMHALINSQSNRGNQHGQTKTVRIGNRVFSKRINPRTGNLESDASFQNRINKTVSRQAYYNRRIRRNSYSNFINNLHPLH